MKKATDFNQILDSLLAKRDLGSEESKFALGQIMQGKANPSQIAAFLTALKVKGETAQEIIGLAMAMRESSIKINASSMHLVDTCGTGGDSSRTFNISTCAALVAAGAGACVAKHGNRAATSQSGSADVLEALGVKILTDPLEAKTQLETIGIAFLYAPAYHPAMKTVAPIRKELGFKTVFNILGPLTNPAGATRQLMGVYDRSLLPIMSEAAKGLGAQKALLVSSDIDEISVSAPSQVYEISKGKITNYEINPEDFGINKSGLDSLRVAGAAQSATVINSVLSGKEGPARDIVLMNSAAAIYVSGLAASLKNGFEMAQASIDSGKAFEKLEQLKGFGKSIVK